MAYTMARKSTKKKEHYVNNADFLAAIIKYKEKVKLAEEQGNSHGTRT